MIKQSALLVATVLLVVLAGLGFVVTQTQSSLAQTALPTRPNILFVLTDDMMASDLSSMPQTRELLADGG